MFSFFLFEFFFCIFFFLHNLSICLFRTRDLLRRCGLEVSQPQPPVDLTAYCIPSLWSGSIVGISLYYSNTRNKHVAVLSYPTTADWPYRIPSLWSGSICRNHLYYSNIRNKHGAVLSYPTTADWPYRIPSLWSGSIVGITFIIATFETNMLQSWVTPPQPIDLTVSPPYGAVLL